MADPPAAADVSAPPTSPAPSTAPLNRSLVVVSNRLPFTVEPGEGETGARVTRAPGGLVSALEPVLSERGGVWIGWNGVNRDDLAELAEFAPSGPPNVRYHPVPLGTRDVARYYDGFSNATLWPLFHYFVGKTRIDARAWRTYEHVNQRFATAAAAESQPGAVVWIHDYHLLRVAHHLRRSHPRARIAFFLHIPFPAADVFRVLPWSRLLMQGMLAADLVGFHVPTYAEHFLVCAERLLGCEVDWNEGTVYFDGRQVSVQAHPVGVDFGYVEQLAEAAPLPPAVPGAEAVAHVLGVDRLDYTKGIHQRLLAVERLLEAHAVHRRHMVFTQCLVPSREQVAEYGLLKREIDEAVGRVNGRFSERGWSPIRYMVRSLPPEELVPLYRQADVALVTPLRDGMNLVAKEYVASRTGNDGVLVLSEMAGAAEELQEAVLVNPFDIDAVAEALHRALTMPEDERRARMSALRDRVRTNDVHAWVRRFLSAAETATTLARSTAQSPADAVQRALAGWLAQRPTVALFLDYDGTLTPLVERPEQATLPAATRQTLEQAARRPNLDLVIVSGRGLDDVRTLVGIPGLTYVGNHGFEIEGPGISYRQDDARRYQDHLDRAADDLERLAIEGAWVERKGATISYHVRAVPEKRQLEAKRRARATLRHRGLRPLIGHQVVEGRPPIDWHKGQAVLYVLRQRHGADWPSRVRALYVGDDLTDEDAFRSLRGIGRSVCVTPSAGAATAADFRLPDPPAVLNLLRWLASGGFLTAVR